ncbi:CehA/McbA family metallohydrolase [Paenibacillus rhizovicinus]|uniref:CehA/McbA family metallohydrolase n=1 Tax=Paenibacillus rhizovicinus TaxID=2704463 RepID=A0A6C0P0I8_9BACL|nr:CehA/McbA family metallohydrolase [Paenibacillus rhizovicinus]QHW31988.1 CehA/McbA family metallohydrolase [Paenibacillus rhizovicinus]
MEAGMHGKEAAVGSAADGVAEGRTASGKTCGKRRLVLRRWIGKDEERTYLEVPFQLEGEVERIDVAYRYERGGVEETVVDIGLRAPERIVGWSGGDREAFFVGLEKATPGYRCGPIAQGEWAVLLGAYKIPAGGAEVVVEVELSLRRGRWMKGDLHMHSVHSDGRYTVEQAKESCRERGLEFMALTDHNTSSQNLAALAPDEQLLLVPGVELTSYFGHANAFGAPDALRDFRVVTAEQADGVLIEAQARGAFVSLNHPFCPACPWELGFDAPYDAVEVWNGPWRALNERAVAWWHGQLAQGRRLVALGGSDTHRVDRFVKHGRPTASVWTESDTVAGLLDGIRRGRVVLSFDPDETCMNLVSGEYGVGDIIPAEEAVSGVPLKIDVCGAKGDRISLWSDRGIEAVWDIGGADSGERREWERFAAEDGEWAVQREIAAILAIEAEADAADACGGQGRADGTSAAAAAAAPAPQTADASNGRARISFQGAANRLFYRLEARRHADGLNVSVMTCMTNPIYIGRAEEPGV